MAINTNSLNLKNITTFGLPAECTVFDITDFSQIPEYFSQHKDGNYFIIGGGSNIICAPEICKKNIIKINIQGIEIINEDGNDVFVKIGAGVVWDQVVDWSVNNNFSGIEALSAIPGTAGATPVQNVGAYGREVKDVFVSLAAYEIDKGIFVELNNAECEFSYRQSIFKGNHKGQYIITSIVLKLSKNPPTIPNYPAVVKYFNDHSITSPTVKEIRDVITEIRWSKLPHPEELGNCGSFFENPIVSISIANSLKEKFQDMPVYDLGNDLAKIPAGYLIEKAGLKGFTFGPVGTYEKNALVLVNLDNAEYIDVINAKNKIIQTVKDMFDIELKTEPEFVG